MRTVLGRLGRCVRRNRWRALGGLGQLAVVAGALGACVGLAFAGEALLRPGEEEGLPVRVELWAFWCMTAQALVFGYTTFEVLFRDSVGRRISRLPVPATALFAWKVARVYRAHLPLVLIPVASGASLLLDGRIEAWLFGVGTCVGALLWGLAAAVYAHVWAGASLLGGTGQLKSYLAGGFGPPESAFLFYSPAMALTAALSIGMLCDLALATGVTRELWGPLQVVSAGLTVAALVGLWKAREMFVSSWHSIEPAFADAEVLPPWREGEQPRTYAGEGLGRLLPESHRVLWRRDLVQYRRRYRVIPPLLVVAALVLLAWGASTGAQPGGTLRVALAAIAVGVIAFMPLFRMTGPELGTRFDARALPVDPEQERWVQWLLGASEWVPIALGATIGAAIGAGPVAALAVLGAVSLAFGVTHAVAIPWALRVAPEIGRASAGVRGGALLLLGLLTGLARVMGG